ncbi:PA14 domain-containing protein [Mucisphaera calidilacus]|uniref:PA14 domain protein n=1 Tax=Mucisphaera calidilacus TaxID=2527982 RepID=A0A518BXL0_9BACT|nr:PA14 domain-containing protein [Mucisphaera calidilacus]QDU71711.1 PA14 domain protein [Mucisphaera calidilacus]
MANRHHHQTVRGLEPLEPRLMLAADAPIPDFHVPEPVYEVAFEAGVQHNASTQVHAAHDGMGHTLMALLPDAATNTVAVRSGLWSDPDTWGGALPQSDDVVVIPGGIDIVYDMVSDTSYRGVRVDHGARFEFHTEINTRLVVDTFVAMPGSAFSMGSEDRPIQPDVRAELLIDPSRGAITDPQLIGRGLLTHGNTTIVGSDKIDFLPLALHPSAGDQTLVLDGRPDGWRVGDILVLTGTTTDPDGSNDDNSRFHDEVLRVTSITERANQTLVTFHNLTQEADGKLDSLLWDHHPPEGFDDWDLTVYAANMTRNVLIQTLDADQTLTQQRGHTMFMHSAQVVIRNASFYDLGRSDKNRLVDEPVVNVDGTPGNGTNQRGRYALHLHRLGAGDLATTPAVVAGNAVWGSPGWGIVHHDSHANLSDNVVFDVVGSAIVAEDGNEIGTWSNNLTIKTTGDDRPELDFDLSPRVPLFDFGFNGEGFWLQGAGQILMDGNIAASSASAGIMLFSNVDAMRSVKIPAAVLEHPEITQGDAAVDAFNVPARGIFDSTVLNAEFGLITWGHMRNQDGELGFTFGLETPAHRLRTTIEDFAFWAIRGDGIFTQYTSQTDFRNGLILGDLDDPVAYRTGINGEGRGRGVGSNTASKNLTYDNLHIEGFEIGLRLLAEGMASADEQHDPSPARNAASRLLNSTIRNVDVPLQIFGAFHNTTSIDPHYFVIDNTAFEARSPHSVPAYAHFESTLLATNAFELDASDSYHVDTRAIDSIGIASYGWDFDADGVNDAFGRKVRHTFDSAGPKPVTLTIVDTAGRSTSVTRTLDARPAALVNPLGDGTFDDAEDIFTGYDWRRPTSADEGLGWVNYGWTVDDGVATRLPGSNEINHALNQVVRDQNITRGVKTLSFEAGMIEQAGEDAQLRAVVYGVNAPEFVLPHYSDGPPVPIFGLEGEVDRLLDSGDLLNGTTPTTAFELEIDFGQGYEFIVVVFESLHVSTAQGDQLWLDNIRIEDSAPVPSAPFITSRELPAIAMGTPIDIQLEAHGGNGDRVWAAATNLLPEGLTLTSDGRLTGTATEAGSFTLYANVRDDDRQFSSVQIPFRIIEPPVGSEAGLAYEVYVNHTQHTVQGLTESELLLSGTTTELSTGLFPPGVAGQVGIRWHGYLWIDTPGLYAFTSTSDDGSQLRIGDNLVVDNDGVHGVKTVTGTINLDAGFYPFELLYFDWGGGQQLHVTMSGPGGVQGAIAGLRMSHT